MTNCARRLCDCDEALMDGATHVILDNDPIYIEPMRACFRSVSCEPTFTGAHQPWMNGYIERFIGTVRRELRDLIPLSHRQLETVLRTHVDYYNHHRTHQRTDGRRMPAPLHDRFSPSDGPIRKRQHLGNTLVSYFRGVA